MLRSFEPELGSTDFFNERFAGGDDTFDLIQLRAARRLEPSAAIPERLASHELPDPDDAVRTRRFELTSGRSINSRSFDMSRMDVVARRGDTELWEVENETGIPHNFHVHGVRFRVVSHSEGAVPGPLEGPQDTLALMPGEAARLAVSFRQPAARAAPYMFHCHLLEHEDRGMMGQLAVLPPGASLGEAPEHEPGHEHE